MTVFKIFLFNFLLFSITFAKISDKRLCYNANCAEAVSLAKTIRRYVSDDSRILSFSQNEIVRIYSKSAGSRTDLWGAEIKGKRGYVPVSHIRETKIFYPDKELNYLVDTEGEADPALNKVQTKTLTNLPAVEKNIVEEQITPNSVTPVHEVIDGTTIYSTFDNSENYNFPEKIINQGNIQTPDVNSLLNSETKTNNVEIKQKEKINDNLNNSDNDFETKHIVRDTETKETEKNVDDNKEINAFDNKENEKNENTETLVENSMETITDNYNNEKNMVEKEKLLDSNQIENNIQNESAKNNNKTDRDGEEEKKENSIDASDEENEEGEEDDEEENEEGDGDEEYEEEKENTENSVKSDIIVKDEISKDNIKSVYLNDVSNKLNESVKTIVGHIESEINSVENNVNKDTENVNDNLNIKNNDNQLLNTDIISNENNVKQDELINNNNSENIKKFDDNEELNVAQVEHKDGTNDFSNDDMSSTLNPLNYFSSNKIIEKNSPSVDSNKQVPPIIDIENKIDINLESVDSNEHLYITTESTEGNIDNPLVPTSISDEAFTVEQQQQNSIYLNDKLPDFIDVHPDTSIKPKDLLKDISNDFNFEPRVIPSKDSVSDLDDSQQQQQQQQQGTIDDIISNTFREQSKENNENSSENLSEKEQSGFFSNMFTSLFGSPETNNEIINNNSNNDGSERIENEDVKIMEQFKNNLDYDTSSNSNDNIEENSVEKYLSNEQLDMQSCKAGQNSDCPFQYRNYIKSENGDISWSYEIPENAYTIFLYLLLTSITVLLFSLGYYYIEKRLKDGKLIVKINELEKELLIKSKEYQHAKDDLTMANEKLTTVQDVTIDSNELVNELKHELHELHANKCELEEQVTSLEMELEKATETGMEMSKMLNDMLTSQSGSEHLMKTINQLQKQLNEQQIILNSTQLKLTEKNTEYELIETELQVSNEKVNQLQIELDKMVVNLLTIQEEKTKCETELETTLTNNQNEYETNLKQLTNNLNKYECKINDLELELEKVQRSFELKSNEYDLLKQNIKDIELIKSNDEALKALFDVSELKAEVQQLRDEKQKLSDKLQTELNQKLISEKKIQVMLQEVKIMKDKLEEAEKGKVEAETRLEVLSTYFKQRENQYQKEINENETKWIQKEGEASSTIERIKWIQEEMQNYKTQNELLKKEIIDQEISLKSQISVLEKKSHENWLLARQAERKLEESRQESSQLRNRLTIVEKNLNSNQLQLQEEIKLQNRIMSPLDGTNGDVTSSPLHLINSENPGSPPLLYPGHRDHHITTSPALPPGLSAFMPPPPPGVPFMPPPLAGVPPFMPPPPALFPGDHRPPPLGRISSPPLHGGRYTPDSRIYSPYDRDRNRDHDDSPPPSPPAYNDNNYRRRTSPSPNSSNHMLPPINYGPYSGNTQPLSPWEETREYRSSHNRNKQQQRLHKDISSGSNESLENSNKNVNRV